MTTQADLFDSGFEPATTEHLRSSMLATYFRLHVAWEFSNTDFEKKVARGEVQYHRKRGFVAAPPRQPTT